MTVAPKKKPQRVLVGVSMQPSDRDEIQVAANASGTTLSSYVKDAALKAARRDKAKRANPHR